MLAKLFLAFFKIGLFDSAVTCDYPAHLRQHQSFANISPEQFATSLWLPSYTRTGGGKLGYICWIRSRRISRFSGDVRGCNSCVYNYSYGCKCSGTLRRALSRVPKALWPATVGLIAAAVIPIGEAAVMPNTSFGGNSVLRDMTILGGMHMMYIR